MSIQIEELARNVRAMMRKQREYFDRRDPRTLQEARDWEKRVNAMTEEVLQPPPARTLFPEDQQ